MTIESNTLFFDFSSQMSRLIDDIAYRVEEFSNIRISQLAVAISQTRNNRNDGIQAKVTPLRFQGGSLTHRERGKTWTVERYFDPRTDREFLYLMTFYLPRFQNQSFEEKLTTVFHELFHIHPEFNGDIRRFRGRYHLHSKSQKDFDREMGEMAKRYLSLDPPRDRYSFLELPFQSLQEKYGRIVGLKIATPKIIPLVSNNAA